MLFSTVQLDGNDTHYDSAAQQQRQTSVTLPSASQPKREGSEQAIRPLYPILSAWSASQ